MEALKLENNQILLTTGQVAELYSTTQRTVQQWIKSGKLQAVQQVSNKGRGGVSHMVPLSALDDRTQMKYWKKNKLVQMPKAPEDVRVSKRLDEFSEDDRRIIQQWMDAINAWQIYRAKFKGQMTLVDKEWVKSNRHKYCLINLSVDTLYNKWKAMRQDDYEGLVDKRGRWAKGTNSIPEVAWELFKYYYLDENQHPVSKCVQYVTWYLEKEMPELLPEIPSYDTFNRAVKTIPFAVVKYFREGDKAFEDDAAPYISRMYEELEVGDVWVADSHTLDIMSIEDGTERIHRLTVISFMDVRSRLVTGWHITENPSSEGVLYALRKGILRYGIPRYIYVDNGKEFLCFDIGGRGHRKKRKTEDHIPPGVFARLGVQMWNARVRNAKTKTIERTHREYKDCFSRLIAGFCGGSPEEKPEKLKKTLKTKKNMLMDSELIQNFGLYIEGMYNETPSKGVGMYGRSPIEVYNEELISKRTATAEDLNLMLMRSTRVQTVGRKGVQLELYGEKLYYWNPEFLIEYQGQKVYLRYDPEDLREVRIYNQKDEYLCTVPCDNETILKYGSSKEDVKVAHQKIRSFKKVVKAYNENSGLEAFDKIDAFDLMLWKARKNIEARDEMDAAEAKVLEVIRANEPITQEPAPAEDVSVDLQRMIRNSQRNAM